MAEPFSLAIIPARKGSKRLPGKNIRPFCGKPLVQWSIEAAQASKSVDRVLVTSDDPEVLSIARGCGVDLVIDRPAALATDTASSMDVVMHALEQAREALGGVGDVCLLQATSPLRSVSDIDGAFSLYQSRKKQSPVVSVCELDHPHNWSARLTPDLSMRSFVEALASDGHGYFRLNGAVYLADAGYLVREKKFLTDAAVAFRMPRYRSVDIDNIGDFVCAEAIRRHGLDAD